jgi:hypothetical protein
LTETMEAPPTLDGEVVITLKGDGGAPWIVVHGSDAGAAGDQIEYLRQTEAFAAVQQANAEFAAARQLPDMAQAIANVQAAMPGSQVIGTEQNGGAPWAPGSIGAMYGGNGGGQQLPQQFQPGGQPQFCQHGAMTYVANGKFGPFWACPLPRDTPGKCKARNAR